MNKKSIIILSICAGFLFFKYLAQLFPSLIAVDLMKSYHINGLGLGIMASSYYYSYTVMQFGAGYFLDKYNAKYSAFGALLLVSLGILIFIHLNEFILMCLGRICMGFGAAFATILYMKCTAMWVDRKFFGIVSSFLATATMLGAAMGGEPVAFLFDKVGWKSGLSLISYFGIVLAVLALIFVSSNKDLDSGNKKEFKTTHYLKAVIIKKDNWILLFYSGVTFIPLIILGGIWGEPFILTKYMVNSTKSSFLFSVMFLGIAIGAPLWAFLSMRLRRQKLLMHIANLFSLILVSSIIYLNISYITTLFLLFALGFSVSVFMLSFQICREINSVWVIGFAVAFINTGEGVIGMFLEPFIGKILDALKTGPAFSLANYQVALITLPICFILSSLSLLLLNSNRIKSLS